MLESIITALNAHAETVTQANALFERTRKSIDSQYIGTRKASELGKAKEILNDTVFDSQKATETTINNVLADVREKANKVVSVPVIPDFVATLEALKVMKNPSKAELESLVGRYKNNYFCYRAICDALGGISAGYRVVTIDEIMERVADLETALKRAIRGNVEGYNYRVLAKGEVIKSYDTLFADFINGRFENVANAISEDDEQHEGGNVIETM